MLRKRIIFTLIYSNGFFNQSRNFRLQKVGDINWLEKNYNFRKVSRYLDELIILNASRNEEDFKNFAEVVLRLAKAVFIPVSAGGKINTFKDVELLFKNGADKIIFNSNLFLRKSFVKKVSKVYGVSSIIASIDYKLNQHKLLEIYIENGTKKVDNGQKKLQEIDKSNLVGEIFLNSIDKDGTGFGFDMDLINSNHYIFNKSIIFSGGAGNSNHFFDAFSNNNAQALSTSNLYNFMGDGLYNVREMLLKRNINIVDRINTY